MANTCLFKGKVKGKRINCEKFLEVFPCGDIIDFVCDGKDDEYTITFCSNCKWGICAYAENIVDVKTLSDADIEKVSNDDIEKYSKYRLVDFAVLFNLDIQIFAMYEDGYDTDYYHYNKSQKIDDKIPKDIVITKKEFENENLFKIKTNKIKKNDKTSPLEKIQNDKEKVLEAVKHNGMVLEYASERLKNDEEIVLAAVKQQGNALEFASKKLQQDEEVALASLENYWEYPPVDYIDEKLLQNKDFIVKAAAVDDFILYAFRYDETLKHWCSDIDVVIAAIDKSGDAINFMDDKLFDDRDFVLRLIEVRNSAFRYSNKNFFDDKEIILKAVKTNGNALRFATKRLKDDEETVLAAISNKPAAIKYASERLQKKFGKL